jgi:hypothetical protein
MSLARRTNAHPAAKKIQFSVFGDQAANDKVPVKEKVLRLTAKDF